MYVPRSVQENARQVICWFEAPLKDVSEMTSKRMWIQLVSISILSEGFNEHLLIIQPQVPTCIQISSKNKLLCCVKPLMSSTLEGFSAWTILVFCTFLIYSYYFIVTEIQAAEAMKWLREAGFPQYAQMYQGEFNS